MVNYPTRKKEFVKILTSNSNRGISFESDINTTNTYYLDENIALIYKKPTPVKVIDVDFKSRKEALIRKAVFSTPSTTDYNGIYKGKYLDFEAKETKSKTSFALSNLHNHQIKHLLAVKEHGGIGFLLVRFTTLNMVFLYQIESFIIYFNNNNRKSIPIEEFKNNGYIVKEEFNPRYNYLKIIDSIYFKEEDNG